MKTCKYDIKHDKNKCNSVICQNKIKQKNQASPITILLLLWFLVFWYEFFICDLMKKFNKSPIFPRRNLCEILHVYHHRKSCTSLSSILHQSVDSEQNYENRLFLAV